MRARVCVPLVGAGRRLGLPVAVRGAGRSAPSELRLARAAAAEAAALVGPDADAQLAAPPPRAGARHRAAERRPGRGRERRGRARGRALPAAAAGARVGRGARRRRRGRSGARRRWTACARGWRPSRRCAPSSSSRLVCLAGERGMAGAAVMEALGALTAPRALVGQGEAVERPARRATSYRRALAALRVAAHEESGTASWDALGVERVVTALPGLGAGGPTRRPAQAAGRATSRSCGRSRPTSTTRATSSAPPRRCPCTAAASTTACAGSRRWPGVNLHDGEDRLLCHLALRLARLSSVRRG